MEHGRHLPRVPWRQVLRRPGHAGHVRHSLLRHGLLRRCAAAPQAATSHRRRAGRSLSTEGGHQLHSLFLLDHLRPHIRHGFLLLHRRLLGPVGLSVYCVLLLWLRCPFCAAWPIPPSSLISRPSSGGLLRIRSAATLPRSRVSMCWVANFNCSPPPLPTTTPTPHPELYLLLLLLLLKIDVGRFV